MSHPYYSDAERLEEPKKHRGQWWSSSQTRWWRDEAIQLATASMNSTVDSLYTSAVRASMVKDFQRKWAVKLDSRVLFDRVESIDLSSDTLRTEFSICVWSVLREIPDLNLSWTYRHYGEWKNNS